MEKNRANICFDCENACGGCSWSAVDPETDKVRFEPVPGWTAEPVYKRIGSNERGERLVETYKITACPQFIGSEYKIKQDYNQLSEEQSDWFLKNIRQILRRWEDE